MSDKVVLSRTNAAMVAHEDAPRTGAARVGLVLCREVGKPTVWGHYSKNLPLWYRHACILNSLTFYQWADCQNRCKGFVRSLPICVTRRYSQRSGERLDFYLQETLPDEESQS